MLAKEFIASKRSGQMHATSDLSQFLSSYLKGEIPEYQISAWLMAVFFQGLSFEETIELTRSVWKSGHTMAKENGSGFWIDKHSTGGIGDKTSLILVPLVMAACEELGVSLRIPMISGRGLGFTGGTLDKLESVRDFSPRLSLQEATILLRKNHFVMMGQTPELAPLDGKLYALRDVTSTVENISLIVGSILGKKLSANLDGLVLDIKCGQGAFLPEESKARELASMLLLVSRHFGLHALCALTSMEEPLGRWAGNACEVAECYEFILGNSSDGGLREVTLCLASLMIEMASGGRVTRAHARECADGLLGTPKIRQIFTQMFEAQGGKLEKFLMEWHEKRDRDLVKVDVLAKESGYLHQVNARQIGWLLVELGGGRAKKEDVIDPWVSIECLKKIGECVTAGETLLRVYVSQEKALKLQEKGRFERMVNIFKIERDPCSKIQAVKEIIQ